MKNHFKFIRIRPEPNFVLKGTVNKTFDIHVIGFLKTERKSVEKQWQKHSRSSNRVA